MYWFVAGAAAGFLGGAFWASSRARAARARADARARAERLDEQVALVGTIASGIAHEIRNPLSTLRMNLQLLREDWEDPITEREHKGRKRVDVLLRETGRLETVVSDFVRFAAGHALKLERTDLNALAAELLDFLGPQAERSRIRIHRDFARPLPLVEVDVALFRQSLLNLLVNAQQAMPSGGEIAVRTYEDGPHVKIEVRDNGAGIPSEHLERIFTLYFSTKPGGTGLGLPMVKKIIEEHGGAVEVRSEPGKGAAFTLCLKKPAS
jgi:two-component system, NtrC family, sensor histidine kinase HydH